MSSRVHRSPSSKTYRHRHHIAAVALILLCWSGLTAGPASGQVTTWGGRFKSLNLRLEPTPTKGSEEGELSFNSLRLTMQADLPYNLALETALETGLLATHPAGLISIPENNGNRALDLTKTWGKGDAISTQVQIDRLSLSGRSDHLEWAVGRQAIGFGRILLMSPLDVIAPFAPDAIDTEIRPGVDAVKVQGYFVPSIEIGAYAVLGDRLSDSSWLVSFSGNTGGADILGIAGTLRDRPMVGFGVAGDVGGLGLKLEAAGYAGKHVSNPGGDLHHLFTIAALECWYRFSNGLILTSQYLYNGAGTDRPTDYVQALESAPIKEGMSFLLGQHYLLLAPSYELHPLATLSGLVIWNLDDSSCLLRPALDISLSDNVSLMIFWAINLGNTPERGMVARSEFGTRGDSGGLFLSWHF
ncbi:MAG: hypothetical protein AB7D06_11590 [Pedobacter sp.]